MCDYILRFDLLHNAYLNETRQHSLYLILIVAVSSETKKTNISQTYLKNNRCTKCADNTSYLLKKFKKSNKCAYKLDNTLRVHGVRIDNRNPVCLDKI